MDIVMQEKSVGHLNTVVFDNKTKLQIMMLSDL